MPGRKPFVFVVTDGRVYNVFESIASCASVSPWNASFYLSKTNVSRKLFLSDIHDIIDPL